jgi:HlyD family secretion protein
VRARLVFGLVVTAAVGASAYWFWTARQTPAPAFRTAAVSRGDVVENVDATGTVQAVTTVQVGTQVSGTIKALRADFNSRVRRGQVVAELDPSLFEAQVAQARASVARMEAETAKAETQVADARRRLARARELAARRLISEADLEAAEMTTDEAGSTLVSAKAQVTQAKAALHQADVNLAHTIITAPIDGIVISRNVDVGQTVAASMQAPTLYVIAQDLARMRVEASIAEADIGRIAAGQPASFRVDAYPGAQFAGTVSEVRLAPVVQQNVVSYVTVIDAPNPDLRLKPGMTATVAVEIARATGVLRVPNAALRLKVPAQLRTPDPLSSAPSATSGSPARSSRHDDEEGEARSVVWLVAGEGLRSIPVRVGISDGSYTAVSGDGLTEQSQVVTGIVAATTGGATPATSPLLPTGGRIPGGGRGGQRPRP